MKAGWLFLLALAVLEPACAGSGGAIGARAEAPAAGSNDVRLVIQITVDGLRGDLLHRYGDRFAKGGFRHLLDKGAVYANAHYQHANTETIVGHATLATGAAPAHHGMIGNVWFDRVAGELAYNIEDPESPILPTREDMAKGAQVDPAQKRSRTKGRSPRAILATTFGDELFQHTAGRAKVFGIGGKDRSAVAMAGHVGKAFWYSTDTGDFVTSSFYYDAYPEWAARWNAQRQAEARAGEAWTLLEDSSTYLLGDRDDRPYETDLKGYGRVFPHVFGPSDHPLFFTRLLVSPVGDQLTADFAKVLLTSEGLGQDAVPDYLSISFSGVDAVNHFFGPSSLENEDVVRQLDRTLADLLAFVDEAVGLHHTLIVLSADHGMPEMPEAMAEAGLRVGRLGPEDILGRAKQAALEHTGVADVVRFFFRPYLYLDRDRIEAAGHDPDEVEQAVAAALTATDGIALAVARSELPTLADTDLVGKVRRNTHPSRSGDVYVVQEPYWFIQESGPIAVMHGSPWRYDTYVPIVFAGPGIASRTIHRRVHPVDVAPTLASYLGVKPPSSAVGASLEEVLP
jgi:predicted AlkP superfamily pyrophosphatase or phosphodiesterase